MAFHRLRDKKGTDVSANVFHFALPDDIWAVSGPAQRATTARSKLHRAKKVISQHHCNVLRTIQCKVYFSVENISETFIVSDFWKV